MHVNNMFSKEQCASELMALLLLATYDHDISQSDKMSRT